MLSLKSAKEISRKAAKKNQQSNIFVSFFFASLRLCVSYCCFDVFND